MLALFLQPALHAAYRADDTWNSTVRGKLALSGESLPEHLWWTAEHFIESGRPNVLGTTQGLFTAWVFDVHAVAYHAFIVLLTVAAAGVLYALVRELGLTRGGALLVITLVAGAIQFRSYHDAVLGYSGVLQIVLILTLASVLLFLRGLRRNDRRLLIWSFLLFLPCPLLYEGAYTLVGVHVGVALLERRGWAAVRASLPFVALGAGFVVLSLIARATATSVVPGYEVGSSPLSALQTYVIQLLTPLPASNIAFKTELGSFIPLGGNPTKAELLAGVWRGAAVFGIVLLVGLRLAGRDAVKLPPARTLWGLAVIGALLWTTSVMIVSTSPKYQTELVVGRGHLPALIQSFGWALVATAALLALLRSAVGRSTAAVRGVALGAAALLGVAAGFVGFNNVRVVAVEAPIVETRALLEQATAGGAFEQLPRDSSLLFTQRDLAWQTGSWSQVPEGIEAMLIQEGDRRLDGRIAPERFDCPRSGTFPPPDCEPLGPQAAWVHVRARPGGGSVVVAKLPTPAAGMALTAATRDVRIYVRDEEAAPRPPRLLGTTAAQRNWRPGKIPWRKMDAGENWAIFQARLRGSAPPVASSLNTADGQIDFTALGAPDRIVRVYGAQRLLP
jgi:hypothetical protein